jgi:tRNA pseudouridine38-40 synthase
VRYFFEIAYDGSNYHGWQKQDNAVSVQEVIAKNIAKFLNVQDLDVVGCGRTDAGVHASQYFFHLDLEMIDVPKALFNLNNMLPNDISIHSIFKIDNNAHARFDAESRTYQYYIHQKKNPFIDNYSLYYKKELDLKAMNDACVFFLGKQDFTSFSKLHTGAKTNFCVISEINWSKTNEQLIFHITANRFLRNMVRSIVGTMLEVGIGKIDSSNIPLIIEAKNRNAAGYSVPAQGLFLEKVVYPYF